MNPICCGRPMREDNGQKVCTKCGSWTAVTS